MAVDFRAGDCEASLRGKNLSAVVELGLREQSLTAAQVGDWLERGGKPDDPYIGKLSLPKTHSIAADVTDDSPLVVQLDAIRHATVVVNREFINIAEYVRPRSR